MKKKLLALAVAGAFVAPVAMADTGNVVVYGVASVSYDSVDNGTPNVVAPLNPAGTRTSKVSSNASRIGFKGSEALGGGTSAIWQIESAVKMDNQGAGPGGSTGLGGRNTFAGLSGESWGSLVLGNHDTAYKIATRRLDLFDETIADNRSLMGGVGGGNGLFGPFNQGALDARRSDVAHYTSPNMSGFSIAFTYLAGAELATTSTTQTKGTGYALAGMYDAGPLFATLAYALAEQGTTGTGTLGPFTGSVANNRLTAWKLGAGYKVDQFEADFAYEKTRDNFGGPTSVVCGAVSTAGADCQGHNAWTLGGKYNIGGSDAVKLAYSRVGELAGANVAAIKNNSGAHQVSLGYDHAMSKRTTVYALYTKLNNDTSANYGLSTYADNESTGLVAVNGAGADPTAISLGMKHTF